MPGEIFQDTLLDNNNVPKPEYSYPDQVLTESYEVEVPDKTPGQEWAESKSSEGREKHDLDLLTNITVGAYGVNGTRFIDDFDKYFDIYKKNPDSKEGMNFIIILGFIHTKDNLQSLIQNLPAYNEFQELKKS